MGKGSSKAPDPPDPRETAQAEAEINRVDVYGPQGLQQQFGFTDRGRFVAGTQPEGKQAAVRTFENPYDAWMRGQSEQVGRTLATQAVNTSQSVGPGAAAPTAARFRGTPLPRAPSSAALDQPDAPRSLMGEIPDAPTDAGLPARASADPNNIPGVERALFDRAASLVAPQIERQDRRLQNRLQAQGIPIGGEAWDDTYGDFTDRVGDTWNRLAMDAVAAGGAEQSRRYGLAADERSRALGEQDRAYGYGVNQLDMQRALGDRDYGYRVDRFNREIGLQDRDYNYATDARGRAIDDAATFYDWQNNERSRNFGELSALLGGGYTPVNTVRNPTGVQPVNIQGAINTAYQGQLANHQAQQQANSGMWRNIASLGGAGLLAFGGSSRSFKTDLGEIESDIALSWVERMPIHAWRYKDGTPWRDDLVHIGPFAEDFHEITDASTDEAIFATDPAGVALAAVKGLLDRIRALEARITELTA